MHLPHQPAKPAVGLIENTPSTSYPAAARVYSQAVTG